jgi:hypothetical protein
MVLVGKIGDAPLSRQRTFDSMYIIFMVVLFLAAVAIMILAR